MKKDGKLQWVEGLVTYHTRLAKQSLTVEERVKNEGLAARYQESVELRKKEIEKGFR